MVSRIESENNRIVIVGRMGLLEFRRVLAALHNMTTKKGYSDIVLDFGPCHAAFQGPMISLCTAISDLRHDGIDFDLRLPEIPRLKNLFRNTNWAYLLDPAAFEESTYRGDRAQLAAISFSSPREQHAAVNNGIDKILSSVPGLSRPDLSAIEWALNEVTDNVLTHSESRVGGVLQLSSNRTKNRVEFAVSDAGVGIPRSLQDNHPEIRSDTEALDRAIREGVTRDKSLGQGNGLFGTYQITRLSKGFFHVHSGYARLDAEDGVHIKTEAIPCTGTLVVAGIDRSNPNILREALKFGGRVHTPVDYIETHYEADQSSDLLFLMHEEAASFGSRVAGTPVRTKLENLAAMNPRSRVVIDMSEVALCSSSFADEVFGKLFLSMGVTAFMGHFELRGVSDTVRNLIDRAVRQRGSSD